MHSSKIVTQDLFRDVIVFVAKFKATRLLHRCRGKATAGKGGDRDCDFGRERIEKTKQDVLVDGIASYRSYTTLQRLNEPEII